MINFGEFLPLPWGSPYVVTSVQLECYRYNENKSGSNMNELRYRMFTKKHLIGYH